MDSRSQNDSRRNFFRAGLAAGVAGIAASGSLQAQSTQDNFTRGDSAILQFTTVNEQLERELTVMLADMIRASSAFGNALADIDPALPQYMFGIARDEASHAEYFTALLAQYGAAPLVDLASITPTSPDVAGDPNRRRLLSLSNINIDTSFYTKNKSALSPDVAPTAPVFIEGNAANQVAPLRGISVPPLTPTTNLSENQLRQLALGAALLVLAVEDAGQILYTNLLSRTTSRELALDIASILPIEAQHYAAVHTSVNRALGFTGETLTYGPGGTGNGTAGLTGTGTGTGSGGTGTGTGTGTGGGGTGTGTGTGTGSGGTGTGTGTGGGSASTAQTRSNGNDITNPAQYFGVPFANVSTNQTAIADPFPVPAVVRAGLPPVSAIRPRMLMIDGGGNVTGAGAEAHVNRLAATGLLRNFPAAAIEQLRYVARLVDSTGGAGSNSSNGTGTFF